MKTKLFILIALVSVSCSKGGLLNPNNSLAPQVVRIVPDTGTVSGGTKIEIFGVGFVNGAKITLGQVACSQVTWISATELTCVTPSAAAPGAVNVAIANPNQLSSTLTKGYIYTQNSSAEAGHAVVSGGSVSVVGSDRIGTVTVGEMGAGVIQTGTHRIATVGIQSVLGD